MNATIAICTRNGAGILAAAVEHAASQIGVDQPEILVVDNASTDNTRDLVAHLSSVHSTVVYVYESRPGLSFARNAALRNARGSIVAFVDDDALAQQGWLAEICDAFEKNERVVAVGGRVVALFEGTVPEWYSDAFAPLYATIDLQQARGPFPAGVYPVGTNMAFRSATLRTAGIDFDVRLPYYNDEVSVFCRISELGLGDMHYLPSALVLHRISAERATAGYLTRRLYRQGAADFALSPVRTRIAVRELASALRLSAAQSIGVRRRPAGLGRTATAALTAARPLGRVVAAVRSSGFPRRAVDG